MLFASVAIWNRLYYFKQVRPPTCQLLRTYQLLRTTRPATFTEFIVAKLQLRPLKLKTVNPKL
ncbi:hypothetical protein C5O19_03560 [Siphonobacter curvatus]|uniref:Uncharacterized protein n=1 Tax=Siphonobacter curvatus TaxID=2094562 RepID=A0A2S7ILX9_9BACT|nr:hypothetical protein C5O19_03560 [Siphonobacter curvatus]